MKMKLVFTGVAFFNRYVYVFNSLLVSEDRREAYIYSNALKNIL